ncbi:hypothetical protein [Lampropedia cohaerens]|nr:hypothetical protein [Lampropedia cohaerens]
MTDDLDIRRHHSRMSKLRAEGLRVKYMHLSALSPTTRKSHADRHGQLFTAAEVREFWSDPENIKGCKCSITEVMVDELGKPIVPSIQKRALKAYETMKKRGYEWSK